jgi:hypothetical protein
MLTLPACPLPLAPCTFAHGPASISTINFRNSFASCRRSGSVRPGTSSGRTLSRAVIAVVIVLRPSVVNSIKTPRRSLGSGRRRMSPPFSSRSNRLVIVPVEHTSADARRLGGTKRSGDRNKAARRSASVRLNPAVSNAAPTRRSKYEQKRKTRATTSIGSSPVNGRSDALRVRSTWSSLTLHSSARSDASSCRVGRPTAYVRAGADTGRC